MELNFDSLRVIGFCVGKGYIDYNKSDQLRQVHSQFLLLNNKKINVKAKTDSKSVPTKPCYFNDCN